MDQGTFTSQKDYDMDGFEQEDPLKGATPLVGLFKLPSFMETNEDDNSSSDECGQESPAISANPRMLTPQSSFSYEDERTYLLHTPGKFPSPYDEKTPKVGSKQPQTSSDWFSTGMIPNMPSIGEDSGKNGSLPPESLSCIDKVKGMIFAMAQECTDPATWIGSCMFLLFHVVYSLTLGATITRPHCTKSLLGLMAKTSVLGIILASPIFWVFVRDIPAQYPTVDLFAAPFLADIAWIIDDELHNDKSVSDAESDEIFVASFIFLSSVSLLFSGALLVLASVFKLANIGMFLPFHVLSGFFSAVGVLTWTLAFKIDANGLSVSQVFLSGDVNLIINSLFHHAPSVLVAAVMNYMGPKNPFYVVALVFSTIAVFYAIMCIFHISLNDMIDRHWFWKQSDLHYSSNQRVGESFLWTVPIPFGWIIEAFHGKIHWGAVRKAYPTTMALSFLYLIRCSIHGAALKKNVPMLSRVEKIKKQPGVGAPVSRSGKTGLSSRKKLVFFSERIDIENVAKSPDVKNYQLHGGNGDATSEFNCVVTAKPSSMSLQDLSLQYANSQFVCGLIGSFAITPSVASAHTMYRLGAERLAPQVGSVVLLFFFYLTNFQLVGFIPKTVFSSLLLLAFIDMISSWFIKSFLTTKEKIEWLVVPLIIVLAFTLNLLQAVFLGIAMSTFLFVASFNRSGVVKYVASGLTIRSTIERPPRVARWLGQSANQIQILILQNYLFFGNASSILSYVTSMFEDSGGKVDNLLPPIPKVVILDLTLVTGMDTSAVDAFKDILVVCGNHNCKLFFSGVSTRLREVMSLCGVNPEDVSDRSKRKLRFFPDLDSAIGKAEDMLIQLDAFEEDSFQTRPLPLAGGGFRRALNQIDEQHHVSFADTLIGLQEYTIIIDMEAGETLYQDQALERGLFFIEYGVMKIEHFSDASLSRSGITIGRNMAKLQAPSQGLSIFRVARVGAGWVLGSTEALGGSPLPDNAVAVTDCRMHYIPYSKILEIEKKNPVLILQLYKLLSYVMAKRQELTISQLSTLHSIMSAPAATKPISRKDSLSSLCLQKIT